MIKQSAISIFEGLLVVRGACAQANLTLKHKMGVNSRLFLKITAYSKTAFKHRMVFVGPVKTK